MDSGEGYFFHLIVGSLGDCEPVPCHFWYLALLHMGEHVGGHRKDKNHTEGLPTPDLPCLTSEDPVSLFHNLWGDRRFLMCSFFFSTLALQIQILLWVSYYMRLNLDFFIHNVRIIMFLPHRTAISLSE